MASLGFLAEGAASSGQASASDSREADFEEALLREQFRSLARLGPYIHGVVLVATVALCFVAGRASSLFGGTILLAALLAVSLFRLMFWLEARGRVEAEALDAIRREVFGASMLGPALGFTLCVMTAVFTRHSGDLELSLALFAIWIAAAACSFCLNTMAGAASVVVAASAAPLIIAFLIRGDALTFWLAALLTVFSCLVIRMLSENFRLFAEIVRSRVAIAEKQRAAEDARQKAMAIALTDDLTGLPNRRCFQRQLAERVREARQGVAPFAVGLLDLNAFKPVNDLYGHAVGDEVLRQVAARLAKAIGGRGSAARMGGDEFSVICDGVGGARDAAIALGQEIQAMFTAPFRVGTLDIPLTGACGFALCPSSAVEPDKLVRLADDALYRAKAVGPGTVAIFDPTAES